MIAPITNELEQQPDQTASDRTGLVGIGEVLAHVLARHGLDIACASESRIQRTASAQRRRVAEELAA